jgi:hypothetical protein
LPEVLGQRVAGKRRRGDVQPVLVDDLEEAGGAREQRGPGSPARVEGSGDRHPLARQERARGRGDLGGENPTHPLGVFSDP